MIKPPFVHPIVYDGVDAAVSHCQPIEGQVHVWGVPGSNPGILCEHNLDKFPVISFEPSWYMNKNISWERNIFRDIGCEEKRTIWP